MVRLTRNGSGERSQRRDASADRFAFDDDDDGNMGPQIFALRTMVKPLQSAAWLLLTY